MAKLNSKLTDGIRSRVKKLVAAEIAYSWKGSQDVSALAELTNDRNKARRSLEQYLQDMDKPKQETGNAS